MIPDHRAFILEHTRLQSPPHTPELQLYLASEIEPIWRQTEEMLQQQGLEPPFWAFAWAGGQALARYLMDHPEEVRGRRVLDFATGSGLVAIAAMKAGAAEVLAADIDPFCEAAVALNAEANGVEVSFTSQDLLEGPPPDAEIICAGDICYAWPMADRARRWLEAAHATGRRVLIGDPGRAYLPREGLEALATYEVHTTRELEDREVRRTGVFALGG
jgi:predicted nicotinamide N-methyase